MGLILHVSFVWRPYGFQQLCTEAMPTVQCEARERKRAELVLVRKPLGRRLYTVSLTECAQRTLGRPLSFQAAPLCARSVKRQGSESDNMP